MSLFVSVQMYLASQRVVKLLGASCFDQLEGKEDSNLSSSTTSLLTVHVICWLFYDRSGRQHQSADQSCVFTSVSHHPWLLVLIC